MIAVLFLQANAEAQAPKANAQAVKQKTKFSVVDIVPANPDEWDTTAGRVKVQSHLIQVIGLNKGKTGNPVKFKVGFEFDGKERMDVKHLRGEVSIDVTPLIVKTTHQAHKNGSALAQDSIPDTMKRRIVDLAIGQNEIEFDLPAGDYVATVLASNGQALGGWISNFVKFTVVGEHDPKRVPEFKYKNLDKQKPVTQ